MNKLEIYTGFRGTEEECLSIWNAWEKRVGRVTDSMVLLQFASFKGLYWNGFKLVPESVPTEIIPKPKEFFIRLFEQQSLQQRIREAIVKSDVCFSNKLEDTEIDSLVDDIMDEVGEEE